MNQHNANRKEINIHKEPIIYIDNVAKYFGIPKSTLLFWEQQGLIHFERDPHNNYRKATASVIFDIELILHFRSLGVPIETIKRTPKMTLQEKRQLYDGKTREIEEKIAELKRMQQYAIKQVDQIDTIEKLRNAPYQSEAPDFRFLVPHSKDTFRIEVTETDRYVLIMRDVSVNNAAEGSIADGLPSSSSAWEFGKGVGMWKSFLLDVEVDGDTRNSPGLYKSIRELEEMGLYPRLLIARYLAEGCTGDTLHIYYKAYAAVSDKES